MPRGIRPERNALRDVRVSTSDRTETAGDGKRRRIRAALYHCVARRVFVCSRDEGLPPARND